MKSYLNLEIKICLILKEFQVWLPVNTVPQEDAVPLRDSQLLVFVGDENSLKFFQLFGHIIFYYLEEFNHWIFDDH